MHFFKNTPMGYDTQELNGLFQKYTFLALEFIELFQKYTYDTLD
jgi:hypothetical protein